MLGASTEPLVEAYDLAMLDLDGVVYIGGDAVPGAPEHLARLGSAGMQLAFITNNASRPPEAVVEKLAGIGVEADRDDVVTSAQAAARLLVERLRRGRARWPCSARAGLEEALRDVGLEPVAVDDERAVAMVDRLRAGRAVARRHARGRADPRRAAVGGEQHRPARSRRAYGVAPGHGVHGASLLERFSGRRAGGGRQAAAAAAGRDRPAGGRRAPADGGRPARHRHRGRARRRRRLAAGADRGDRPRRAGGGARPRLRPTYLAADLDGPARAARRRRSRDGGAWRCGRLAGDGRRTGGWRWPGDGRRRRLVAGGRGRGLGRTSTAPARWPTSAGWPRRARPRTDADGSLGA